jgi:hypothetical protein
MWLRSVSGHRLFFLLGVGYLGESPFFFLAARAGGLQVSYCCSPGLLNLLVDVEEGLDDRYSFGDRGAAGLRR